MKPSNQNELRVLIACEESQVVCKAMRELGFEAYSCDILPCSGGYPEWHIKTDVLKVINGGNWQTEDGNDNILVGVVVSLSMCVETAGKSMLRKVNGIVQMNGKMSTGMHFLKKHKTKQVIMMKIRIFLYAKKEE